MEPITTGQMKQSLRRDIIAYDKAEAASFAEIALYLFTAGRKGRVYKPRRALAARWTPQHVNCRCKTQSAERETQQ